MNVVDLIEAASKAKGSALELARDMRKAPARLSEWKKGKAKPDAVEIAYMARVAGLPVLITVAMVESDLHPESAELWAQALGEAKAPAYWSQVGANCILCLIATARTAAHQAAFFRLVVGAFRGTVSGLTGRLQNA